VKPERKKMSEEQNLHDAGDIELEADAKEGTDREPAPLQPPTDEELAELRQKAAECDNLTDRLKRVTADYLNSQKRLEREMQERSDYAIEGFARELLVVSDDLARAVAATEEHQTVEAILEGLHIVEQHLYSVLERHAITPVRAEPGQVFNPEFHEAIAVEQTPELEPNHIVREVQKGFLIRKRLLRPARVVVSAEPREQADEEDVAQEPAQ